MAKRFSQREYDHYEVVRQWTEMHPHLRNIPQEVALKRIVFKMLDKSTLYTLVHKGLPVAGYRFDDYDRTIAQYDKRGNYVAGTILGIDDL